ncbi:LysE family translocator [Reinekea thalattae]|uniref:LysE family translocator n=2 Tax=Reinekea thalattae TaxID=2593301 RepID=A0A5C8ZB68_9GAMM|nr:LysE family translocator [Reinekea thalattae]
MNDILIFLPGIITAYSILIGACLSPGPAVMMLMGLATEQGRTKALTACAGIALGSVCINLLTLLGVGLLLSEVAWAMLILRLVGTGYLLYLAYGAFKKSFNPPPVTASKTQSHSLARCFSTGLLLQVTNPKAIAFWLAITSVGAVHNAGITITTVYVFGACIISFVCHGAWALMLSAETIRRLYSQFRRWVEACLGGFFVFVAAKMASS